MSIAGELNILATTKAVQRRHLERLYPYLDWSKMPFSSYNDFFALKNIMDDCGAIWTNAYRKSNDEDAETRKYLTDYSGNGRDIELFNFAFAGMSGYGGYIYDESNVTVLPSIKDLVTIKGNRIDITNITKEGTVCYASAVNGTAGQPLTVSVPAYRIRVTGLKEGERIDIGRGYNNGESNTWTSSVIPSIFNDGTYDIPAFNSTVEPANETAVPRFSDFRLAVYLADGSPLSVSIEIMPLYPGALVSDGVDDYGQCIKQDFALTDFTVCAIRRFLGETGHNYNAPIVGKVAGNNSTGAFLFEQSGNPANGSLSFGNSIYNSDVPELFSYLTPTNFNGKEDSDERTYEDSDKYPVMLFGRPNTPYYRPVALYAVGIFTRTLTEEELRIVKNCMMAEWGAMTGELDGITYVADWDAKGRSNDEEEPMRSQWIDKVNGKIINLSNYAYSQMSGWNGYIVDFRDFSNKAASVVNTESTAIFTESNTQLTKNYRDLTHNLPSYTIKVSGMLPGDAFIYYYRDQDGQEQMFGIRANGIYILPECYNVEGTGSATGFLMSTIHGPVTIEQLPYYPGALVSDGVDDYGVSAEVIDEPIGSVIMHAESLSENFGKYLYGMSGNINRIYCWIDSSGHVGAGAPSSVVELPFLKYTREPVAPNLQLWVSSVNNNAHCKIAIFRLILIQEQLDAAQLEFLEWKVEKEYRDYLIRNGWEGIKTPEEEWYGIEWDVTDPSPDVKRIGNMEMHKTLPVHSQITGVLLDDTGAELKVLGDDWTAETRDGSAGQVMVKMPVDSYWKFESDGNKRRVKLSDKELSGFTRTPLGYVSAYEASLDRYNYKLASVVDTSGRYRGGNNQDSWDNSYNTQIGRPATNINRTYFRTHARSRQSGSNKWNIMTYDFQKLIYWLFAVEYATLDTQKTFNAEKSTEGYAQGGLGDGVTLLKGTTWNTFSAYYPFIPCGYSDSFGNSTGQSAYTMPFEYDVMYHGGAAVSYIGEYDTETAYTSGQFVSQGEELYECIADAAAGTALTDTTHFSKVTRTVVYVPRYRGIENPYGHVWQWTDGINVRINPNYDDGTNGLTEVFVCSDPSKFSDNGYVGYTHVGNGARDQNFVSEILFGDGGEIMPKTCEGSSDTYFCDYHYMTIPNAVTLRAVMFGGSANNGTGVGLICSDLTFPPSFTDARFGTRLCFIPEEENTNS